MSDVHWMTEVVQLMRKLQKIKGGLVVITPSKRDADKNVGDMNAHMFNKECPRIRGERFAQR